MLTCIYSSIHQKKVFVNRCNAVRHDGKIWWLAITDRMGKGTEKLCKFYCFRLSKLYDAAGGLLAVNYNLQEAICVPFPISWVRGVYICHIHNIIHVGILMAQRHVFYLWVRPKKNDSVKGYDESSPRIFMARPTPSRAASCSPCVHQYKTDNLELM